ncbi:MAG TPA: sulfatase-like hydrolase/transferase [Spirochaetota bacterium]|nr:sulfatase-like hydrolase/transferase [Spirochaetota bacterium]
MKMDIGYMKGKEIIKRLNLTILLFAIQGIYFILFFYKNISGFSFSLKDLISALFSFITLLAISSIVEIIIIEQILALVIIPLLIIATVALYSYRLHTGYSVDFSLIKDNIGISFSPEAFSTISSPFSAADFILAIIFVLVALLLELRFKVFSAKITKSYKKIIAAIVVLVIAFAIPFDSGDEFTLLIKSIFKNQNNLYASVHTNKEFPYEKQSVTQTSFSQNIPSLKKRPNIILILIESFNANFTEKKAPDGIDYTPFFNSLINKGLYIERFYGNSIQTCKGQAAVFFSILPSFNGKIFVDYSDLNIKGFPSLLAENGYETIFFQAYHNLKFDNTEHNMRKAGFNIVKTFAEFKRKEDRPYIWGWGVEDRVFYERFFEFLDSYIKKNPGKPFFAALPTVGTHIPCDGLPMERREIYKNPENIKEKYSNALRLSDRHLEVFFKLLKERAYLDNTVIIITSDHSFPMKEHGIYNNEVCFYDEAFRIPMLILWEGVISPKRIRGRVYSQVDIGPTIADIAGVTGKHNMIGISIFDSKTPAIVYLIQPYNGKFLQTVDYPYKYIKHLKTGKEYLFNLEKDPLETSNIINANEYSAIKEKLQGSLEAIYTNQKLIEENKIISK